MKTLLTSAIGSLSALSMGLPAMAHHGWSSTTDEESRLEGKIQAISFTNPHMHLVLRTDEGIWEVDLAPPFRAERAGFVSGVAAPGDTAVIIGHKSRTDGENYFKAEVITVNGTTYDVYPNREKTLMD
ncbi:MAG: hypothetical protein CMK06_03590 [Ponticaulis sp.]|nr:hypothetical protein [Ponticaulis sp.]